MLIYYWAVVLFFVTCVYMLLCVEANPGSILGRTRIFVFIRAPAVVQRYGRMICGDRFVQAVNNFWLYLCYKPNPIV